MNPALPNVEMCAPDFASMRVDAIAHEVEDALSLRPLPVHQAAVPESHDDAVVVPGWIERPDLLAGRGVQRDRLQAGRRHVHDAVHHDRIHVHRGSLIGVAGLVLPRALEPMDVGRVNLRQRRVLVALLVAAIHGPVHVCGSAGGHHGRLVPGNDRGSTRDRHDDEAEQRPRSHVCLTCEPASLHHLGDFPRRATHSW